MPSEASQRFRGYNDNFPAMSAMSTLVGGWRVGAEGVAEGAIESLKGLVELLNRRGLLSEHTSPTYSAITLTCLADIVELSDNAEARDLALHAEERVWEDVLAHFHAPTGTMAGPFSRAYTADLLAHPHNIHVVLRMILGEVAFVSPLDDAAEPLVRHNGLEHLLGHLAWHASSTYHPSARSLDLATRKPDRCTLIANAEQASFPRNVWRASRHSRTPTAEFAAGVMNTNTYFEPHFAVGRSDRTFLDGSQHAPFHVTYARRAPARSVKDIATVFSRFFTTDQPPRPDEHIGDMGRALTVGEAGTTLVLYAARPEWGQATSDPEWQPRPLAALRTCLVVSCLHGRPDEVYLGSRRVESDEAASGEPVSFFLRDGPFSLALHPICAPELPVRDAVSVEFANGLLTLSIWHYRGPPRAFTDVELLCCRGGFVAACESSGSFADFMVRHNSPRITDHYAAADGMRHVRYEGRDVTLAIECSPVSGGVKSRTVNGRLAREAAFALDEC